jgi:hypothetical protein
MSKRQFPWLTGIIRWTGAEERAYESVPHSPLRGVRENNELEINLFISTHVTHPARQLFYTLQTNPISAQTGFARNHKQTSKQATILPHTYHVT